MEVTTLCPICGCQKPNPLNKTCSRSCATKLAWQHDSSIERLEQLKLRFKQNNPSVGRPKGSKNINPYPVSEAVKQKWLKSPPPSWLGRKHKIETREKMSLDRSAKIMKGEGVASRKGFFKPKNPQKYIGDPTNIVFRSSWELKFFMYIDEHEDIIQWASEELRIPYRSPKDGVVHHYIPDVILKKSDGTTTIIEIKPKAQCMAPTPEGKPRKRFVREVITYGINQAKWASAREYCNDKGWKFQVITEKELGISTAHYTKKK